jgi:hypothetical protein
MCFLRLSAAASTELTRLAPSLVKHFLFATEYWLQILCRQRFFVWQHHEQLACNERKNDGSKEIVYPVGCTGEFLCPVPSSKHVAEMRLAGL